MDLTDIAIPAGASGATLVLVGMVRYAVPSLSRTVRHWLKGRAQSAQLAADLVREREQHLYDRVDSLEKRVDEGRDECNRLRREDRAKCDEDIAAVRSDVHIVARRLADEMAKSAPRENTGLHELQGVMRRSTTPLPQRIDVTSAEDEEKER